MGQTQGYIGLFHAIVRNFLLDLVMFKLNVTMIARMPVFFKFLKTIFQKNVLRAILFLNSTPVKQFRKTQATLPFLQGI